MDYKNIVKHYERCFDKYGDTSKGVDWTQEKQVYIRYKTMLEIINFREKSFQIRDKRSVLDFGCGLSHLYEYILNKNINYIEYIGLEISEKFYNKSKEKYPFNKYLLGDLLVDDSFFKSSYDYIVMNGLFTEKRDLSYEDMFSYFSKMITKIYQYSKKGIAFNVMSKQVDWEKDFLFHVPLDDMANFLTKNISRDFIIRNDYGLYEYTVYLYKRSTE